ncbi:global transactivator [Fusarium denticulatum]|uniref:Global transactivator n=1 Tax=Fusarium denticulatum TaxID=48507 RepID=A0A8H5TX81_9HYPO|nr:global transactivator [Fusarium denticulatum]
MLHGHPITSFLLFQAAFTQSLSSDPDFPEDFHRERYIQMLDASNLRRPHITAQQEYLKRILGPCAAMRLWKRLRKETQKRQTGLKKRMEKDENRLSRPVRVITGVVDQHKDRCPDHSFLIVDESIYFLDMSQLPSKTGSNQKLQLEYNGRLGPIDRHYIIRRAFEAEPSQVMLATRATGGQGLNLQCFNAVI